MLANTQRLVDLLQTPKFWISYVLVKIFLNTSSEEQLAIALFHPRYLIKIFLCLVGFIRLLAPLAAPVCIPSHGGLGDEGSGCFCSPASCRISVAKAKAQILAFQGSCLGAGADLLAASSSTGSREHRTDLAGGFLSWEVLPCDHRSSLGALPGVRVQQIPSGSAAAPGESSAPGGVDPSGSNPVRSGALGLLSELWCSLKCREREAGSRRQFITPLDMQCFAPPSTKARRWIPSQGCVWGWPWERS